MKVSDVVLLTGTTLVNGTFDALCEEIRRHGKEYLFMASLPPAVCPYGAEPYLPLWAGIRGVRPMNIYDPILAYLENGKNGILATEIKPNGVFPSGCGSKDVRR